MATINDPRAAGFNAAEFRSAIEFAMNMGTAEDTTQRLVWVFEDVNVYDSADKADPTGLPYDLTASVIAKTQTYEEVEVPVAMEFISRSSQGRDSAAGFILPSHVEVYIQDTYIDQVREADYAILDGNRYEIVMWSPPLGLFEATIYPCLLEAVDQSGEQRTT